MDGWGESVSPWQPITNDPTPRTKKDGGMRGWMEVTMGGEEK